MNIFILSNNMRLNAIYHTDAHVSKMILEHAQILSTVVRQSGIDAGYKEWNPKHPCVLWCGESLNNWFWLKKQTFYLAVEHRYRQQNRDFHSSWNVIKTLPIPNIPAKGRTSFALAMPDQYKTDSAVKSYRTYYLKEKTHLFSWKRRTVPYWIRKAYFRK